MGDERESGHSGDEKADGLVGVMMIGAIVVAAISG